MSHAPINPSSHPLGGFDSSVLGQPGQTATPAAHGVRAPVAPAVPTSTQNDRPTAEEMTGSLNGYDDMAIRRAFNLNVGTDAPTDPVGLLRALVFVHERRGGRNDTDAKAQAMQLTFNELQGYFREDDEPTPETPVTEAGKDVGLIA